MKPSVLAVAVVGFALCGVSAVGLAADRIDLGKDEYKANCAVCHGLTGTGDGPYKPYITESPTNLTVLQRNNKGVFPFSHVYQVIDGRAPVTRHGTSDMLIWGREYSRKAGEYFMEAPGDPEAYARARILALTEYISQIQVK
jgi:mono/diheme cytochrome c family protein